MKLRPIGKVTVSRAARKREKARLALEKARALLDLWAKVDQTKASGITLDELRRRYIDRQAAGAARRRRRAA